MEEELNKKIAEWVGIKPTKSATVTAHIDKMRQTNDGYTIPTTVKDAEYYLIDFTSSLDALFQFAVPKLTEVLHYRDFYKFLIAWVAEVADGKKAALMFCRAVEKLIDNS